jgi:hypothetical protein
MRPLQELPISTAPTPDPGGAAHRARAGAREPLPRRVRRVIGLVGGMLWWGGLLWFVLGPEASTVSVRGWVAAGGWGLGLIPLHAVPACARASRRRRVQA